MLNVRILKESLQPNIIRSLLFFHAITLCDTTSRPYGIGKVMAVNKCDQLMDHASPFMDETQIHESVKKHGQVCLEKLYNFESGTSFDFERAPRFSSKVASRLAYLPPESLPPAVDSATYHSYRMYHQVQA